MHAPETRLKGKAQGRVLLTERALATAVIGEIGNIFVTPLPLAAIRKVALPVIVVPVINILGIVAPVCVLIS